MDEEGGGEEDGGGGELFLSCFLVLLGWGGAGMVWIVDERAWVIGIDGTLLFAFVEGIGMKGKKSMKRDESLCTGRVANTPHHSSSAPSSAHPSSSAWA